jgi:SAM-dependent methyltransferase
MSSEIYLPPKHHIPALEDPINFYYIPLFRSFFIRRLEITLSFAQGERLGRVLDIGCGTGVLFPEFARRSDMIVGIDTFIQDYSIKGLLRQEKIIAHLAWGDVQALPFKNETFDTIVCISALEHISANERAQRDIKRILRTGGRFLAGFPVRNWLTNTLLGESTGFHSAGHEEILASAKSVWGKIKIKHIPAIAPLDWSLYCAFEGRKER